MNLSEETRLSVRYAALVHDLGKLYIPAEILGKPSPLSRAEYELVKKHPEFGHDILSPLNFPWPLAKIVLQHHERMDGQGYPFGLTGQQIIFEARLLSVVDAFDAMTSDRPYRKKKSTETALIELSDLAGTVYDAKIVEAFVTMIREKLGVTV
jgi:HD-GYP domain-containing protein (c-di-GMP phosphodiesterase class II)